MCFMTLARQERQWLRVQNSLCSGLKTDGGNVEGACEGEMAIVLDVANPPRSGRPGACARATCAVDQAAGGHYICVDRLFVPAGDHTRSRT